MARPHLSPNAVETYLSTMQDVETSTLKRLGRPPLYMVKRRLWNSWLQYTDPNLAADTKKYLETAFHQCERTIQNDNEESTASNGE